MFMIGASKADPTANGNTFAVLQGDPSQTFAVTVEQYRLDYVFLAPNGTHVVKADKPVLGYGDYTTYMYPGGLNLGEIAPIPPK